MNLMENPQSLNTYLDLRWCILGDFNDLLAHAEKIGNLGHLNRQLQGFQDTINFCGLKEIRSICKATPLLRKDREAHQNARR